MKGWITSVGLVAIMGCAQPATTSVDQEVTDCTPGGNYKDAKLPALAYWNGYPPPAATSASQLYLDYADPTAKGQHIAFLVDPDKGYVLWAALVKDTSLKYYRQSVPGTNPQIGDCCRPPPPPPGGDQPGFMARYVLEYGLRFNGLPAQSWDAAL